MRRPLTVCRAGLAAAAAVVLLSACGGSGDHKSASSSSSARSTAASSSAQAAGSAFCTQAASTLSELQPALTGSQDDPAKLAPALQQAADKVRAIQPPSEISSDWTALADGIQKIAQIVAQEGAQPTSSTAQQQVAQVVASLTPSATKVQTYLSQKCGLTAPTETAAPAS